MYYFAKITSGTAFSCFCGKVFKYSTLLFKYFRIQCSSKSEYAIKEIKTFLVKYFDGLKGYQIIIEKKKENCFVANAYVATARLCILFSEAGFTIRTKMQPDYGHNFKIFFPFYSFNDIDNKNKSIFETVEERLNPEQFREKLVTAFKMNCPEKILKSFKGDEDIWNFIMKQGEWKVV